MTDQTIPITAIDYSERLRPIDDKQVDFFASDIEAREAQSPGSGLLQPIRVRPDGDGYVLISGAHRLAAMRLLEWPELVVGRHVIISHVTPQQALLDEIAENLVRRELEPLDRAIFLAKQKDLYEDMYPETGHGKAKKSKKSGDEEKLRPSHLFAAKRFTADVAQRVNLSEGTISLAIRLANALDSEAVALIRGTPVERSQKELLALADLDAEQQVEIARTIRDGEAKSVAAAGVHLGFITREAGDPQTRILTKLTDAWGAADPKTRRSFMALQEKLVAMAWDAADEDSRKEFLASRKVLPLAWEAADKKTKADFLKKSGLQINEE